MKNFICVLGLLLGLPTLLILSTFIFARTPNSSSSEVLEFTIKEGERVFEISKNLKDQGLIQSSPVFQVYVFVKKVFPNLQAGVYYLPRNLSVAQIVDRLQHGTNDIRLTFVEGWRREEYGSYIKDQKLKIKNKELGKEFLKLSENLEGYLFPDTYFVSPEITAGQLVAKLKENFDEKFSKELEEEAVRQGLTKEEVVILASIVEREAKFDEDRPKVAEILIKRYQNGLPLEADATIQYALGKKGDWWPKKLEKGDLLIDSPYNTRKVLGLPPMPICNPGLESIKAVVRAEETDYWYYVSDKEGKMHYAVTYGEHSRNVAKYLGLD